MWLKRAPQKVGVNCGNPARLLRSGGDDAMKRFGGHQIKITPNIVHQRIWVLKISIRSIYTFAIAPIHAIVPIPISMALSSMLNNGVWTLCTMPCSMLRTPKR